MAVMAVMVVMMVVVIMVTVVMTQTCWRDVRVVVQRNGKNGGLYVRGRLEGLAGEELLVGLPVDERPNEERYAVLGQLAQRLDELAEDGVLSGVEHITQKRDRVLYGT
jgi:hypothetical protein